MAEGEEAAPPGLDDVADELYALPPEEFVAARDDRVAAARERGERDLARAVGKLRRPTRPAWLANLLARERAEQVEGLVALAAGLAQAQQTLDGTALRALSAQRHRAVAAMAREAGRLAEHAGSPVTEAQLRELHGILEAALARPEVAEEVRAGRLTRTLSHTGFGPGADPGAAASEPTPRKPPAELADPDPSDQATVVERERAERERAAAEEQVDAALARQAAAETARDEAWEKHRAARDRVAELTAEVEAARERERATADAARETDVTARTSAREATTATGRAARARARWEELGGS